MNPEDCGVKKLTDWNRYDILIIELKLLSVFKFKKKIKEARMSFFTAMIIIIVWCVVGLILFFPYAWLAGGVQDPILSTIMTVIAPIVVVALAVLLVLAREEIPEKGRRKFLVVFWTLLIICNLPIVLRFTSIGLKALSYALVSDFVFRYRFYSIPVATAIAVLVTVVKIYRFFRKTRKLIPQ